MSDKTSIETTRNATKDPGSIKRVLLHLRQPRDSHATVDVFSLVEKCESRHHRAQFNDVHECRLHRYDVGALRKGGFDMTAVDDLDVVIEQYHRAAADFIKGDPEPYKRLFSQRNDVTLGNPFGPVGRGWKDVAGIMDRAASQYTDGEITRFENIAKYHSRTGVHSRSRAVQDEDCRTGSAFSRRAADDEHLSTRRRHVEDRASARRFDHDSSSSRIGDPDSVITCGTMATCRGKRDACPRTGTPDRPSPNHERWSSRLA